MKKIKEDDAWWKEHLKTKLFLQRRNVKKSIKHLARGDMCITYTFATAQNHYKETGSHLSGYDFSKWLNNVYVKERDAWIKDVSSKAVKQSIMNGDRAFKNFF